MSERLRAALDLIREMDINRLLMRVGRDNVNDHMAVNAARQRYDAAKRRRP